MNCEQNHHDFLSIMITFKEIKVAMCIVALIEAQMAHFFILHV
jgi:hypothetical protein